MTTPNNHQIDAPLTALATAALADRAMVADQILPRIPVAGPTFKYRKFGTNLKVPSTLVSDLSRPGEGVTVSELAEANVEDHARIALVSLQQIEDQNRLGEAGVDIRAISVLDETTLMMKRRELEVAAMLADGTTGTTRVDLAAGLAAGRIGVTGNARFDAGENSTPIKTVTDAIRLMVGNEPDTMITSRKVIDALRQNPRLQDAVYKSGTSYGVIPESDLAGLLGLTRIIVIETLVDTAAGLNDEDIEIVNNVNANDAYLLRTGSLGSIRNPSNIWGFTATLGGRVVTTEIDRMVGAGQGAERIKIGERRKEIVLNRECKVILGDVVS